MHCLGGGSDEEDGSMQESHSHHWILCLSHRRRHMYTNPIIHQFGARRGWVTAGMCPILLWSFFFSPNHPSHPPHQHPEPQFCSIRPCRCRQHGGWRLEIGGGGTPSKYTMSLMQCNWKHCTVVQGILGGQPLNTQFAVQCSWLYCTIFQHNQYERLDKTDFASTINAVGF